MTTLNLELLNELPGLVLSLQSEIKALKAEVHELRRAIPKPLVTVKEAMRLLDCSDSTVRRMIKAGELRTLRIGTVLRIDLGGVVATNGDDIARLVSDKQKI